MSQLDLILLHPPSVYDFRKRAILYGPISDLIPSSPVFEMYPLGFLTMVHYLEERGMNVRIINLALRMMNDRKFDVPTYLKKLTPRAFAIDLHWLPHAHGAIEIARILKSVHRDIPVILGGLSSTYFHEELIRYPEVDFVLRGDSAELPLFNLLENLDCPENLSNVPNLTWKSGERVRINPMSYVPQSLDYVDLAPEQMVKMVVRYRDLQSVLPFNGWWKNPITAVFTAKGCAHHCKTCGGSHDASKSLKTRFGPVFRSPVNLVKNIIDISCISRGPIFLVGDLLQAGEEYAFETLDLLKASGVANEIIFEVFGMPDQSFLRAIDDSLKNWSLELSPESHDEEIRRCQDTKVFYRNEDLEAVIREALSLSCHRVDVFFMIGLMKQTKASVLETIGYCEHLFQLSDERLSCFISPMGPFLDPGSLCFEHPEEYGYRLFAHSLEEHRQLLQQASWKQILNYETEWMSREDLVDATYAAAERLNALKLRYGRIESSLGQEVATRIEKARQLESRLSSNVVQLDPEMLSLLQGEINEFSVSTVCDKRELFWKRHVMNFKWFAILRLALELFWKRNEKSKWTRERHA